MCTTRTERTIFTLFQTFNKAEAFEPRCEKTGFLHMRKQRRTQISCAVTAQLISAFVFAIRIKQTPYYLNPKFQASSHLLWLYNPVCVGPGRKPRRPVFLQRGSFSFIRNCIHDNISGQNIVLISLVYKSTYWTFHYCDRLGNISFSSIFTYKKYSLASDILKGSPITKALTCMKIYLYKQKWQFLVKETDTSGYIVTYEQCIHYTQINLRPNKQLLSTQQQTYQSF